MIKSLGAKRARITTAAGELAKALKECHLGHPLRITLKNPYNWLQESVCFDIGHFGHQRPKLLLWYGAWIDFKVEGFWVGFEATDQNGKTQLKKLISDCSEVFPQTKTCLESDYKIFKDFVVLRKRPPDEELGFPFEEYPNDDEGYFGIYGTPGAAFDLTKFSMFVEKVLRGLPEFGTPDVYASVENRQSVRIHLDRERDPQLAVKCKERDGYRCQVCDFHYETRYGDLGHNFAEAHHKVPLSHLKGERERSPEHLITVCANCHRMLHKLSGEEGDIEKLRGLLAPCHR